MSNAEVLDILAFTHALVDAGWCKRAPALGQQGQQLSSLDPRAVRYCLEGALFRATFQTRIPLSLASRDWAVHCLEAVLPSASRCIIDYNDAPQRRKRDVLRLIERAAARVGK